MKCATILLAVCVLAGCAVPGGGTPQAATAERQQLDEQWATTVAWVPPRPMVPMTSEMNLPQLMAPRQELEAHPYNPDMRGDVERLKRDLSSENAVAVDHALQATQPTLFDTIGPEMRRQLLPQVAKLTRHTDLTVRQDAVAVLILAKGDSKPFVKELAAASEDKTLDPALKYAAAKAVLILVPPGDASVVRARKLLEKADRDAKFVELVEKGTAEEVRGRLRWGADPNAVRFDASLYFLYMPLHVAVTRNSADAAGSAR